MICNSIFNLIFQVFIASLKNAKSFAYWTWLGNVAKFTN
jgi:hypothetical protein